MLHLAEFLAFLHARVQFLHQRIVLFSLFGHEVGFGRVDFLLALLHVLGPLALLDLVGVLLDLVRLSVVLLLGHVLLLLAQVQQLSAALELR